MLAKCGVHTSHLALWRLRQEDCEFKASPEYVASFGPAWSVGLYLEKLVCGCNSEEFLSRIFVVFGFNLKCSSSQIKDITMTKKNYAVLIIAVCFL